MGVSGLADLVLQDATLVRAVQDARDGTVPTLDLTGPAALRPFVVKGLVDAGRTVLVVDRDRPRGRGPRRGARATRRPGPVGLLPGLGDAAARAAVARAATPSAAGSRCCAGSSTPAPTPQRPAPGGRRPGPLGAPAPGEGLADLEPVELTPGDEVDLDDVVRRLAGAAYTRVDLVEKRGEFAVRGGIVDVFPPTEEHPLRVEFSATRSRRSAPSRSPTSAPSSRSAGSGRRRAASCC